MKTSLGSTLKVKTSLGSTFKSENVPGSFKIRGTCTINLSIAQIDRLHRPTVLSVSCNAHYNLSISYQYHFHNIQYLNHNFHQLLNFIQYLHHNNSTPSIKLNITIPDNILYTSLSPVSEHYYYTHSHRSRSVTTTNQHNQHNI